VDENLKQLIAEQRQPEVTPVNLLFADDNSYPYCETFANLAAVQSPYSTDSSSSEEEPSPMELTQGETSSTVITTRPSQPTQGAQQSKQSLSESLTDAERRRLQKRADNNGASRRSRAKKKEKFRKMEQQVDELQKENEELKQKLQRAYKLLSRITTGTATLRSDEYPIKQYLYLWR